MNPNKKRDSVHYIIHVMVHQIWEYRQPDVPGHQRQQSPMKASDRSRNAVDEAKVQWLQSEERAKILSEKLSTALADITSKDNLVKQHVKVAEEAVSGTFIHSFIGNAGYRKSISRSRYIHTYIQ